MLFPQNSASVHPSFSQWSKLMKFKLLPHVWKLFANNEEVEPAVVGTELSRLLNIFILKIYYLYYLLSCLCKYLGIQHVLLYSNYCCINTSHFMASILNYGRVYLFPFRDRNQFYYIHFSDQLSPEKTNNNVKCHYV